MQNIVYLGNIWEYPAALARLPDVRVVGILYEDEADNQAALRVARSVGAVAARVTDPGDTVAALKEIGGVAIREDGTSALTLGVIANFGIILPPEALEAPVAPERGYINFHPGLLPDQAGREPVRRLWETEKFGSGLTIHRVVERVDAGPVLFTAPFTLDRSLSLEQNTRAIFLLGLPYLHRIFDA